MIPPKRIPNAEKWTAEAVTERLQQIKIDAMNEEVTYLGNALIRQGLYTHIWRYWRRKFADHEDITELMLHIESIFEVKLFEGALRKEFAPWIAVFGLKNNHHWREKEEAEANEPQGMLVQLDENTIVSAKPGESSMYKKVPGGQLHKKGK
jgi:hypothetical protein